MSSTDLLLFDAVAEACRTIVPPELGLLRARSHRYGTKIWFDTERPGREHYEAQVVGARYVEEATVLALEIGFHAEHPTLTDNDLAITKLTEAETAWRSVLGEPVVVGPFLGRGDLWRRASETWPDPDLGDEELVLDIADRLVDYIVCFEPVLRR